MHITYAMLTIALATASILVASFFFSKKIIFFVSFLSLMFVISVIETSSLLLTIPISILVFPQFLSRKKWLVLYTMLVSGLLAYLYADHLYVSNRPGYNGSFGDAFVIPFLILCFTLLFIGIITRAITMYLEHKKHSLKTRVIVTILGFLSIFPIVYAPVLWSQWQHRAPDPRCDFDTISVYLDDNIFSMVRLTILSFSTGDGEHKLGDYSKDYYFFGNRSFRKFCSDFDNGNKKIQANMLSINFSRLPRKMINPENNKICGDSAPQLPHELCEHSYESLFYPQKLNLYLKGKYNSRRMFASSDTHEEFVKIKDSLMKNDKQPDFLYDGTHYYWRETTLQSPDGKPIFLKCFESGKQFYCTADYPLKGKLQISYGMLLKKDSFDEDFVKYHNKVHEFIRYSGVE
ncbi:MAG: hypothetical protein R3D71_10335 [Rickettsiales bacterium]